MPRYDIRSDIMTVKECYTEMGGNYDEVFGRLRTDERIAKFLRRVAEDKSMELLESSIASGNAEEAFRAAHTLKGICMNLALTKMSASASAATEALRGKATVEAGVAPLVAALKADYELTVKCINALE